MRKSEKSITHEEMIDDLTHHPVRAYFKYPLGKEEYYLPAWDEGLLAIYGLYEALRDFVLVYLLLFVRLWLRVPLRPIYKAYLVIKWNRYFNKKKMKDEGHV